MTHLEAIGSSPRPAGSAAARAAQDYCATHLESLGFAVARRPFEFSALPGRFGAPLLGVAGALLTLGVIAIAVTSATAPTHVIAIAAIVVELMLLAVVGGAQSTRLPLLRTRADNLEAVRGEKPWVWLVAHIDSKSQPVSTAVRTSGVLLLGIGMATTILFDSRPPVAFAVFAGVCAVTGGGILGLCVVGNDSDGAADNASGVAAVLEAASLLPREVSVGVLITDAEELFLAGARDWVRHHHALTDIRHHSTAINCDTVDDHGLTTVLRYQAIGSPMLKTVERAVSARVMWPPPGVLTDSVAFRRAGWQTVTLARGSLRTLARIHTRRDSLRELSGTGIPEVSRAMATLVEELS